MNRTEFISETAAKTGMTKKDTKEVLDLIMEVIVEHMKDEDGVTPWQGIKFTADYKEARTARNPRTGEAVKVPAKYAPKVKFGKAVKEAIN